MIKICKLRENAIVPTKRDADLGYDIYPNFKENYILINPQEIKMIPTGIASMIDKNYGVIIKERGSTGSKGLSVRCGVIDSNYRGEWFVAINNTQNKPIVICKKDYESDLQELLKQNNLDDCCVIYPYEKAIAQAIIVPNIVADIQEISETELKKDKTDRGDGKLGSSGK